jgi:hypothetical protein
MTRTPLCAIQFRCLLLVCTLVLSSVCRDVVFLGVERSGAFLVYL